MQHLLGIDLGTSAVKPDPQGRLHFFCHAVPGKWHLMAVTLSAGGSLRWFRDTLCRDQVETGHKTGADPYDLITAGAAKVPPRLRRAAFFTLSFRRAHAPCRCQRPGRFPGSLPAPYPGTPGPGGNGRGLPEHARLPGTG